MNTEHNKPKMGRPAIHGRGSEVLAIRMPKQQSKAIAQAAKSAGKPKADWAREILFGAAQAA